jgi:Protein of unknown function (DUF998)
MAKVTVTRRTPSEPAPRANPRRALALIGMIGPVLYILLVTALGLLSEGYDPVRDTQSELGAVDSPYQGLMNIAGFMGLGVSILAFSAAYFLLLRKGFVTTLAAGLLAIAGVGMVVVGFFPCDASCVDVTRRGRLHSVFSIRLQHSWGGGPAPCGHGLRRRVPPGREIRHGLAGSLLLARAGQPRVGTDHRRRAGPRDQWAAATCGDVAEPRLDGRRVHQAALAGVDPVAVRAERYAMWWPPRPRWHGAPCPTAGER